MDSKTKIYVGIIIAAILIGGIYYYNWQKNKISLPINGENEATAYAKTDADFQRFMNGCKSEIGYVSFENDIWLVRAFCTDRTDSCYDIRFKSNGIIIDKGNSCIV